MKMQSVEEEYKKTGIKPNDIAVLREWLLTQPHIPAKEITDLDLILCYHSCNYSTEVSKQVLDLNLTIRTLLVSIFENRSVDENLIKVLKTIMFVRLPSSCEYTIAYFRLGRDASNYENYELIRAAMMLLDVWQYEDGTWPGIILLVDLSEFTLSHFGKIQLPILQKIFYYLQEAHMMKIKSFHFINIPTLMNKIMSLIQPFFKRELLGKMYIHQQGSETIKDIVSIEALPIELGGKYKTFKEIENDTIVYLLENKEYFVNENKKRVIESLRPGKPKTLTDIFGGVEGSFKKLDID